MPETFNPHQSRTLDRVVVTVGLAVWDYDLRAGTVVADRDTYQHDNGWCNDNHWFDVEHTDGSRSMMDASRLWTRHPATGQPASAVVAG